MNHAAAETAVKLLQRRFLCWIEQHPALDTLDHHAFNDVRKQLYRATWQVFKLGITGFREGRPDPDIWTPFFGWMENPDFGVCGDAVKGEIRTKCFHTALEAFRLGARVDVGGPE